MKSGIMFEQGDILIVPFPFSDLSSIRYRPVLVLSNNSDNIFSDDIIICGITSNLKDTKHSVLIDNSSLKEGNIPITSRIKIDKLFTIEKNLIKKKIGKLNNKTIEQVKKEFYNLI